MTFSPIMTRAFLPMFAAIISGIETAGTVRLTSSWRATSRSIVTPALGEPTQNVPSAAGGTTSDTVHPSERVASPTRTKNPRPFLNAAMDLVSVRRTGSSAAIADRQTDKSSAVKTVRDQNLCCIADDLQLPKGSTNCGALARYS